MPLNIELTITKDFLYRSMISRHRKPPIPSSVATCKDRPRVVVDCLLSAVESWRVKSSQFILCFSGEAETAMGWYGRRRHGILSLKRLELNGFHDGFDAHRRSYVAREGEIKRSSYKLRFRIRAVSFFLLSLQFAGRRQHCHTHCVVRIQRCLQVRDAEEIAEIYCVPSSY